MNLREFQSKGGKARARNLSPKRRREIARAAGRKARANARQRKAVVPKQYFSLSGIPITNISQRDREWLEWCDKHGVSDASIRKFLKTHPLPKTT